MVGLIDHINLTNLKHLVVDHDSEIVPTGSAVFSPDRTYRYALTRQWNPDRPPAVFIMLNPSTADAWVLDPTVTRCRNFAAKWGCGGLVVLNAFALRATDPKVLRGHPDPVGPDNDQVIAAVLCAGQAGPVIVAWGSDETMRRSGRADQLVALLHTGGFEPQCLGKTTAGHPRHPLYVRGDTEPIPYPDPETYARAMNDPPRRAEQVRRPAPRPCESCPYRVDAPAGLWAAEEYEKLPRFDLETPFQPTGVFLCHQQNGRVCAGWAGCHDGENLLGLRIAQSTGMMAPAEIEATIAYRSPVPLHRSGAEAAAWGLSALDSPDRAAGRIAAKLLRKPGVTTDSGPGRGGE